MKRRMTLFALCALSAAVLAAQTGRSPLRIAALRGPTGLGMIQLIEERPVLPGGTPTEFQVFATPDLLLPHLVRGEFDLAVLPTNLAANLYNRGVAYRLAAVIGNGVLYLLSADPGVRALRDLRGRDVYNVARGATPDIVLSRLLENEGLRESVNVSFRFAIPELAQMMIAGRALLGVLPEPFATMVLRGNPAVRVAADLQAEWVRHEDGEDFPMSVLVVRKSDRPDDAVREFLQAYERSQAWVRSNPHQAGLLAERLGFGFRAADASEAIPRTNLTFLPAAQARPTVERFLSVFLELAPEAIGGRLPDEGFYTVR